MIETRITTPGELNAAALALDNALHASTSPQSQFRVLIAFYEDTAHLPLAWRAVYLLPHAHTLHRLLLHPYVRGFPPGRWISAWRFLRETLEAEDPPDAREREEEDRAMHELLCNAALSCGYVADLRTLHTIFAEAGLPQRPVDEHHWLRISGAGPDPFAMFDTYCDSQLDVLDARHPLHAARLRWEHWSRNEDAVSLVLLEEGTEALIAGAVLRMEISSRRKGGDLHINNVLGADADMTQHQLRLAGHLAATFIQRRVGYHVDGRDLYFQILDLHAAFSGGSLGLAATVGLICHLSRQVNGRIRWRLPAHTACVASLDESGALQSVSWETIRRKIHLAFFSPLRRVVLPVEHLERAMQEVQALQREYPRRNFELYPATTYEDCFRPAHVVEATVRNPYDRAQTIVRRHARTGLLLLALTALITAGVLFYQTYFFFPDLEATSGITVPSGAIVYNPHDSLDWAFRDGRVVADAWVSFGDLEVGDGFTRTFTLYNMTPRTQDVFLSIEGPDAEQWYLNAGGGRHLLESVRPVRVSVRYAPILAAPRHAAALVLRDGPAGSELFRLELAGAAGRALPGGYALRLPGARAYMSWGTLGTAFTHGELTVESWVRSLSWTGCFLHSGYNTPQNLDLGNLTVSFAEGIPHIALGAAQFTVPLTTPMKPDRWYHLALSYSLARSVVRLYLDGTLRAEHRVPVAMLDRMTPVVSLGAYADSVSASSFLDCEVDNFRIWWSLRDETDLRRSMDVTLPSTTPTLKANFDMEAFGDGISFNGSGETPDAELRVRPGMVRSSAPLRSAVALPVRRTGLHGIPALELPPGTYLHFARQVLPRRSHATFAFWWYATKTRGTAFVVKNLGNFVSFSSDSVAMVHSGCRADLVGTIGTGWHHVAVRVLEDGRREIFIDGTQRAVLEDCRTPDKDFHDWHDRYDGISYGIYDDSQTAFSARLHGSMRESLSRPRRLADLMIWKRLLANEEIALLAAGADPPPDHLAAWWRFDHAPSADLNFIDRVDRQLLHVKSAPAYK
ncbi:MAG: LamG-like jellyroll fold domain-containing protein [Bacteroidota bacterium]|nr:LamG-like jellyroll fold domain-containing protein [Bacteroidota bacterium]